MSTRNSLKLAKVPFCIAIVVSLILASEMHSVLNIPAGTRDRELFTTLYSSKISRWYWLCVCSEPTTSEYLVDGRIERYDNCFTLVLLRVSIDSWIDNSFFARLG